MKRATHAEFCAHWSPADGARDFEPEAAADEREGVREHESAMDGRGPRGW